MSQDVVELREWGASVEGHGALVTGLDTAGLDHVIDLGVETGRLDDLGPGRVLVSTAQARDLGVGTGRHARGGVPRERSADPAKSPEPSARAA